MFVNLTYNHKKSYNNTMKRLSRQRISERYRAFAKYFVMYDVATTAAIKAGYSAHTAHSQAPRLLKEPLIQQYIKEEREKNNKLFHLEAEQVLNQYKALALADINNYFEIVYKLRNVGSHKTHERLLKYVGYQISVKTFSTLSKTHQKLYQKEKQLRPLEDLTKAERAAIAGITYDKFGNPVIKLSDKEKSLEALSKILGLYEKDNQQKTLSVTVNNRSMNDFYDNDIENVDEDNPLVINRH